jgi:precorrin-6A/cobalt-precorrin-6A reductase
MSWENRALTVKPKHILLLAGTYEARHLARKVAEVYPEHRLTPSFAGVVKDLPDLGRPARVGGFGGSEGLIKFCQEETVSLIIDATHPYAVQMSQHASKAAAFLNLPFLRLERPAWHPISKDNWQTVSTIEEAASELPQKSRAFLAVGRKEIRKFCHRSDIYALARMIEPPDVRLPDHWDLILARPSLSLGDETRLFEGHGITHVVTKNSGGERSFAKIEAARQLGLRVIMIDRPTLPSHGQIVRDIETAIRETGALLNAESH